MGLQQLFQQKYKLPKTILYSGYWVVPNGYKLKSSQVGICHPDYWSHALFSLLQNLTTGFQVRKIFCKNHMTFHPRAGITSCAMCVFTPLTGETVIKCHRDLEGQLARTEDVYVWKFNHGFFI